MKTFLLQTSLLAGTIIGAGMFSLPFVFKRAGIATGFFYLALATAAYLLIYYIYADIILRTDGEHRFIGYAERYLGPWAYWLSILITVAETIVVLAIYMVLSVSFAGLMMPSLNGWPVAIIFWILGSAAVFSGVRRVAAAEFFITAATIAIIFTLFVFGAQGPNALAAVKWLPSGFLIFLPLAPVLFSLAGRAAIPAMIKLDRRVPVLKKSVLWGSLIPMALYALFVLSILSLSYFVTEDAVSGLFGSVPAWLLVLIGFLGVSELFSSYITIGFDVERSLALDLRIPWWLRIFFVVGGPLAVYFLSSQQFLELVALVGGIFLGLEGILIVCIWLSMNKNLGTKPLMFKKLPSSAVGGLLLLFAAAAIYELTAVL